MAGITFILGGARSGKSSYAIKLAKNIPGQVVYLAPGVVCDDEMRMRIDKHKEMRPKSWKTIEEPLDVEKVFKNLDKSIKPSQGGAICVIFDCLSFWVSNLILHYQNMGAKTNSSLLEEKALSRVSGFLRVAKIIKPRLIIVSNEVGMGIVPDTQIGRIFRDILGRANQLVSARADEVFFLVAGLPIKIK